MPIMFNQVSDGSWAGTADGVRFFVDDDGGKPHGDQQVLANLIAANLNAIKKQAADYLDLFTDRARASGRLNEEWFLEEIEMRCLSGSSAGRFELNFTLCGDDGGYWCVQLRHCDGAMLPIRFGRIQR